MNRIDADKFSLLNGNGSPVILVPTGLEEPYLNHRIGALAVDLGDAGDSKQKHELRIVIGSAAVDVSQGAQRLLGAGGIPLSLVTPASGDGVSSASAKGSGGGFISVKDNEARINATPKATATVNAALLTAGGDVTISSLAQTNTSGRSENGSGGFVADGDSKTFVTQSLASAATVGQNARVVVGGDFTLRSNAFAVAGGTARSSTGGAVGLADSDVNVTIAYASTATVGQGAAILVGDLARVDALASIKVDGNAYASGIGIGGDGEGAVVVSILAAVTKVDIGQNSLIDARRLILLSSVESFDVNLSGDGRGAGFYAEGDGLASVTFASNVQVAIAAGARLTGYEGVDFLATYGAIKADMRAFSRSTGLFGDVDSDTVVNLTLNSSVTGAAGALVTAGPRDNGDPDLAQPDYPQEPASDPQRLAFFVSTNSPAASIKQDASVSRRSLATGGSSEDNTPVSFVETLPFSSDVLILSGRSPELVVKEITISPTAEIEKAVEVTIDDGAFGTKSGVGDDILSAEIVVNNIRNPGPGDVVFDSEVISGNGGTWTFRETLNRVSILNKSDKNIVINNIDVRSAKKPLVWLNPIETVTLQFNIRNDVAPTLITITNTGASDIKLNGSIENPIGTTSIVNTGGSILSTKDRGVTAPDGRASVVRTNIVNLNAATDIGSSTERVNVDIVTAEGFPVATGFKTLQVNAAGNDIFLGGENRFFNGQMVLYTANSTAIGGLTSGQRYYVIASGDGQRVALAATPGGAAIDLTTSGSSDATHTLTPVESFTADAVNDIWLDIQALKRTTAVGDFVVNIDRIAAGDDADVLLQASLVQTGVGTYGGILVKYPTQVAGKTHFTFFRAPDSAAGLPQNVGLYGSGTAPIETTFDFRGIDRLTGLRTLAGLQSSKVTTDGNIVVKAANPAVGATRINILGITEVTGSSTGDITAITNGWIALTERTGDMRIEVVRSNASDVLLFSPRSILDAQDDANRVGDIDQAADVAGVNITMIAGAGFVNPNPSQVAAQILNPTLLAGGLTGGIGTPTNFLEIDVNIAGSGAGTPGVLRAFDTTALTTAGIFLDEITGDLNVHTVWTLRDVSMRTREGSILDFKPGEDEANVLGQSIDLDANGAGASIGDKASGNDLEIDSGRGSVNHDVALEATKDIYVTEIDSKLRLVLAHSYAGDIRITVRESADLDEHLELLHSGSARFAESTTSRPTNLPDAERQIPNGQIFAEAGSVTLRVGDNVTLDSNSEILAAGAISIFGDYGNADAGYGTEMVLRGRIISNAVVTPGQQVDPTPATDDDDRPVGTARPNNAVPNPAALTQIYGAGDADRIDFGDATGIGGTTAQGTPGYIFIGSKTRVYGGGDEDLIRVFYLQDTWSVTSPAQRDALASVQAAPGVFVDARLAEHTLTLDGQADTDTFEIYTIGSNGADERNYVINVLDTGAPDDGVDELFVFGNDAATNGPGTDDIFLLRGMRFIPNETSNGAGFVALLHGEPDAYRDVIQGNETAANDASPEVQRINYDRAINGRLTVLGLGGNDVAFVDDATVTSTIDLGAGDDSVQVGQIFGLKRDVPSGALLESDVFPVGGMIATTRGWLSAGISAPMVVHGGTGNDSFTVYSNQAELRLEGDDGNDIFVIRAFALALVDDKGTADWLDDEILFGANGLPQPIIGAVGFSTARPLDVRGGGGDDEVQYNVNAPVSADGGTGFDKIVILGTEFADDFVITAKGVFGAGVNVRYTTMEVVEVDGLEGDDEFFVQSTAFGVAYRVIGGLGSDTINVTGDVTEDIVVRELEGVSGAMDHRVISADPLYNGLVVDGFDYNVASSQEGIVVIEESAGFTSVREGGGTTAVDSYTVRLAKALAAGQVVYVTVSASRTTQEEEDDSFANPAPLPNGKGDSIWLSTTPPGAVVEDADFQRDVLIGGPPATKVANRAVVLKFTAGDLGPKTVYVYAPDDTRAEGDRVVVVQHSVISNNADYDGVAVRNVEVTVRDNDTPGIVVTQIEKDSFNPVTGTFVEDNRTLVIEGSSATQLTDQVLIQLATAPVAPSVVVVNLTLDNESDQQIKLSNPLGDARFTFDGSKWQVRFTHLNWDKPILVGIEARDDAAKEDPGLAVINFTRDAATTDPNYVFPNLRSGPQLLAVDVIDNDTAGVVTIESGGSTVLVKDDVATGTDETVGDTYSIRLTKQPTDVVTVALLTDGLADVVSVNGQPVAYAEIGGLRASQRFDGQIIIGSAGGKNTLTRGAGADLGSFIDDGFRAGQLIRIGGAGLAVTDYLIESLSDQVITLSTNIIAGQTVDNALLSELTREGAFSGGITVVTGVGVPTPVPADPPGVNRFQLVRSLLDADPNDSWLSDGFLEGQLVRITSGGNSFDVKVALIRGENATFDNKMEFKVVGAVPAWLNGALDVSVTRIAAVATFSGDPNATNAWFKQQVVVLEADAYYTVPPTREGVKVFPASTHLLSKLRGPLAVEGGVTGADRSLQPGLKLPGEKDDYLFAIGQQAPESQQIDVLNIFNDSSQQNRAGEMTSTRLTGFGMAGDLTLDTFGGPSFGESGFFPGGISFGRVLLGAGGFETDASSSTIDVVNLMLGEGDDDLTISGTLNPDPNVLAKNVFTFANEADNKRVISRAGFDWSAQGFLPGQTVSIEGVAGTWTVVAIEDASPDPNDNSRLVLAGAAFGAALTAAPVEKKVTGVDALVDTTVAVNVTAAADGGSVTRSAGNWATDGFLVGHLVTMAGMDVVGSWRVTAISADGKTMALQGAALAAALNVTRNFSVQGPHGGLTVVHGGGNQLLEVTGELRTEAGTTRVTRMDGLSWETERFQVGQHVQLQGESGTRMITAIVDATPSLKPGGAFNTWGAASTLVLGGTNFAATGDRTNIHVAEALKTTASGAMTLSVATVNNVATTTLTRAAGSWLTDGFFQGQKVFIDGYAGAFVIDTISASAITFDNVALTPKSGTFAVFGYDVARDGGVRVGGDRITVTGGAGPNSPLVIYGDTSQDGVWYAGVPGSVLGYDFGPKPFDPFPNLPADQKEDDTWVFPLAKPFKRAGNDVIDASALFASTPAASLPTVGITAYGGAGNDTIIGSQAGDHLAGGSGDDLILGQRGTDHIYGDSGVNVNILTRALQIATSDKSPAPSIPLGTGTNGTVLAPQPSPVRDMLVAGRDVIYGDGPGSAAGGQEVFDDIIFGDHGVILQNVVDPNLPSALLQKIQTTSLGTVYFIGSAELQNGADDAIFGNEGRDIIIGNAGNDLADGGSHDDLIFGDNVYLSRMGGIGAAADDGNLVDDIASLRFQTLASTLLYSRTDRPAQSPGVNEFNSGALLTDGIARAYRDPDGAPWWAEYAVKYDTLHTFSMNNGLTGIGSFGNDYLAGGAQHDQIFGQLGNDVILGDGTILGAFTGESRVGAARQPGDASDPLGPLSVVAMEELATDGEDYIEGGGGDDQIFGGLGQDDLVGGSSSFFSLTSPDSRPDGADYIFGGSGRQIARNAGWDPANPNAAPDRTQHAPDSDAIVGDNGNIVRIVGVNGVDVNTVPATAGQNYVRFNYDNYAGGQRIVVRGVELLDYTPGGPDFRPDLFALTDPANPAYRPMFGIWAKNDIGGDDEVHGESGDDFIYLGGGRDRGFGDAQDDDIIGGWGADFISGGTGEDGILGDDGRIFTSRNSAVYGEGLYGIVALRATDPDTRTSQGDVLNEFIYTPGQIQTAVINVADRLKKTVDLTPFNLDPAGATGGIQNPLFAPKFADDIIFGGLGDDFLHGGAGDDAISGAEALGGNGPAGYALRFNAAGAVAGVVRIDFDRPWNPSNVLAFGADTDPWNAPKPVQSRLGEFFLYDEYDPRRAILFTGMDGQVWKTGAYNPAFLQYFLNNRSDEGALINGAVTFSPNGTPLTFAQRHSDGDDVIFGDLGNDWMVGGTGKDTIWAGWGNDLSQADDVLSTNGWLNDTTDTHPVYEDRVFGGAGLDILIGNTGGDRLIDWVGEFNSYIVPFAPFGIATVSRQVPPGLFEFLYALARSQGADPTRATDTGGDPARLGEPDGELGLITQKDKGLWQDQTGGPTDPQPGNIPGGRRDVLRSASFNDGTTAGLAADAGTWSVSGGRITAQASTPGQQSSAIFIEDTTLPSYFELAAKVMTQKPTAGWKANAYVVFDYYNDRDFKFAGINVSTNKFEMGIRDASGWRVVAQTPVQVRADTFYDLLAAVNGNTVTVTIGGRTFTHTFAARIVDGEPVFLNRGSVGFATDGARVSFDDFRVQVLPPQITLDTRVEYDGGAPDILIADDAKTGSWTKADGRHATTAAATTVAVSLLDLGAKLQSTSYLELEAKLLGNGIQGIVFDAYKTNDFKFVALDVPNSRVIVGHVDAKRGLVVDASFARTLTNPTTTLQTLNLVLKGASVSITLNGATVGSYGYNSAIVDGTVGTFARGGSASFDYLRVRTNDPAFTVQALTATSVIYGSTAAELDLRQAETLLQAARTIWAASGLVTEAQIAATAGVTLSISDLPDATLGVTGPGSIVLDVNAAGNGWFIDRTPLRADEYVIDASGQVTARDGSKADGKIDLLSVLLHEFGHVLGYEHDDSTPSGVMNSTLDVGERLMVGGTLTVTSTPIFDPAGIGYTGLLFLEPLGGFVSAEEAGLLDQHGLLDKKNKEGRLAPLPPLPASAAATSTATIDWSRGWGRERSGTPGQW